jgi:hypothetical protein
MSLAPKENSSEVEDGWVLDLVMAGGWSFQILYFFIFAPSSP